jgi:hypothetical protein
MSHQLDKHEPWCSAWSPCHDTTLVLTAREKKGKKHWVTSKSRARRDSREAKYWQPID